MTSFLPFLDTKYSKEIYQAYWKYHWADYGLLYGFTEWPRGYRVKGLGDVDSGPVFMEIGERPAEWELPQPKLMAIRFDMKGC